MYAADRDQDLCSAGRVIDLSALRSPVARACSVGIVIEREAGAVVLDVEWHQHGLLSLAPVAVTPMPRGPVPELLNAPRRKTNTLGGGR